MGVGSVGVGSTAPGSVVPLFGSVGVVSVGTGAVVPGSVGATGVSATGSVGAAGPGSGWAGVSAPVTGAAGGVTTSPAVGAAGETAGAASARAAAAGGVTVPGTGATSDAPGAVTDAAGGVVRAAGAASAAGAAAGTATRTGPEAVTASGHRSRSSAAPSRIFSKTSNGASVIISRTVSEPMPVRSADRVIPTAATYAVHAVAARNPIARMPRRRRPVMSTKTGRCGSAATGMSGWCASAGTGRAAVSVTRSINSVMVVPPVVAVGAHARKPPSVSVNAWGACSTPLQSLRASGAPGQPPLSRDADQNPR